jgi:hypothetical protein
MINRQQWTPAPVCSAQKLLWVTHGADVCRRDAELPGEGQNVCYFKDEGSTSTS